MLEQFIRSELEFYRDNGVVEGAENLADTEINQIVSSITNDQAFTQEINEYIQTKVSDFIKNK